MATLCSLYTPRYATEYRLVTFISLRDVFKYITQYDTPATDRLGETSTQLLTPVVFSRNSK